jgi:hypothetical protein
MEHDLNTVGATGFSTCGGDINQGVRLEGKLELGVHRTCLLYFLNDWSFFTLTALSLMGFSDYT